MNKTILIAFTLLLGSMQVSAANISTEKQQLIDQLLVQTGQSAIAVGQQFSNSFIQQMSAMLKQSNPNVDPRVYDILKEEISAIIDEEFNGNNALATMMYPIYDKRFSAAELKQMIAFNNTKLGKKIIKVMPMITQEGMQAGQAFGQSIAPKIQQRLTARFKQEGIK